MDHVTEPYLGIKAAAAYLDCSRGFVYKHLKSIPHLKAQGKLLFRASEARLLVEARRSRRTARSRGDSGHGMSEPSFSSAEWHEKNKAATIAQNHEPTQADLHMAALLPGWRDFC